MAPDCSVRTRVVGKASLQDWYGGLTIVREMSPDAEPARSCPTHRSGPQPRRHSMSIGKGFVRSCLGAMALFVLQASVPAFAGDDAHGAAVDDALAKWKAAGHSRPIVETHIHFWQVTSTRWRAVADAGGRTDLPRRASAPSTSPSPGPTASSRPGSWKRAASSRTTSGSSTWSETTASSRSSSATSRSARRPSRTTWRASRATRASWASAATSPARPRASRSARHSSPTCATWRGAA